MKPPSALLPPAVVLLIWPLAAPAVAQSPWERQTGQGQARVADALEKEGYRATEERHTLVLNTGERTSFTLVLESGQSYVLVGVCDADCVALQLALFGETDYEIDAARAPTAAPILRFTARDSGTHRIQVVMAECHQNPCWAGIALYSRHGPADSR
jgi:hypothetical protein